MRSFLALLLLFSTNAVQVRPPRSDSFGVDAPRLPADTTSDQTAADHPLPTPPPEENDYYRFAYKALRHDSTHETPVRPDNGRRQVDDSRLYSPAHRAALHLLQSPDQAQISKLIKPYDWKKAVPGPTDEIVARVKATKKKWKKEGRPQMSQKERREHVKNGEPSPYWTTNKPPPEAQRVSDDDNKAFEEITAAAALTPLSLDLKLFKKAENAVKDVDVDLIGFNSMTKELMNEKPKFTDDPIPWPFRVDPGPVV